MTMAESKRVSETFKRKWDAEKEARCGHPHIYNYDEWVPWTGNNYIKSNYDVLLSDGTVIEDCRPNAGKMLSYDGRHEFTEHDNVKVRLAKTAPW